jgi:small subunit ribosomal protein S17
LPLQPTILTCPSNLQFFQRPTSYLVHDPNLSLREGDIVRLAAGFRTSRHKRHIVASILSPFGTPLSERPPLPSVEEVTQQREEKSLAKQARKALNRQKKAGILGDEEVTAKAGEAPHETHSEMKKQINSLDASAMRSAERAEALEVKGL